MSKTILPGYVSRVGSDYATKDLKASIDEILGTDFQQAAENAVVLARELLEFYPNDPDVHKHITDGVVKLSTSGNARAAKTAEDILDALPLPVHSLVDQGFQIK